MIYPDEEKITYSYNLGGQLEKVHGYKSYGYDYVSKIGYDKFEQRTYLKYCNGAETFYTYDPQCRTMARTTTIMSMARWCSILNMFLSVKYSLRSAITFGTRPISSTQRNLMRRRVCTTTVRCTSFGNNPNITYCLEPFEQTQGNCNSSSSTLLYKAGVPLSRIKDLRKQISGLVWGFGDIKPWTVEEQSKAVQRQREFDQLRNEMMNTIILNKY